MGELSPPPGRAHENAGAAGLADAMLAHQPFRPVPRGQNGALAKPKTEAGQYVGELRAAGVEIRERQLLTVDEQADAFAVAVGRVAQELVERLIRVVQADVSPRGHGEPVMRGVRAWAVSDGSARSIGPGSASVNSRP